MATRRMSNVITPNPGDFKKSRRNPPSPSSPAFPSTTPPNSSQDEQPQQGSLLSRSVEFFSTTSPQPVAVFQAAATSTHPAAVSQAASALDPAPSSAPGPAHSTRARQFGVCGCVKWVVVALVSVFAALNYEYTMVVVPYYAKQFTAEGNAAVREACVGGGLFQSRYRCPLVVTWFLAKDNFDLEWLKTAVSSLRHTPVSSTVDSSPAPRPADAAVESALERSTLERPAVDAVADPQAAAAVESVLERPAAISGADHPTTIVSESEPESPAVARNRKTDKGGSAHGKCSHPGHYLLSSECGGKEWSRAFLD